MFAGERIGKERPEILCIFVDYKSMEQDDESVSK
jgi:hypothetical protein